jgi:putative transposase
LAVFKKLNVPMVWKRDFAMPKKGLTIWGVLTQFQSRPLPQGKWADSKLKLIGQQWYLILSITIEVPAPKVQGTIVGVDSGIKNLFTAVELNSNKTLYVRGGAFNHRRACIRRTRAKVASVGTRSSRRLLCRLSGRERAVTQDFLHVASKQLVSFAKSVNARSIAMEDLDGVRNGSLRKGKSLRSHVHRWPYATAMFFVEYKAAAEGIGFEIVSAKNTSRGCPRCGHTEKANRKGLNFRCVACDYADNADRVGGYNCCLRSILHRQADAERASVDKLIVAHEGNGTSVVTSPVL